MPSFVQSFLRLPARSKGIAAVSAVAVLGVAFLLLKIATAPSYSQIANGMDPSQTGKATAALMPGISPDSRQPGAVSGAAQLVAHSVKGLKPDNVTITDGSGQLLWPQGDAAGGVGGTASKQAAQARYNSQVEANLNALL